MTDTFTPTAAQRSEALQSLQQLAPRGTTVYTVLRHVSASGMTREIDLYVIVDNEPRWLSGYYRTAGLGKLGFREGIVVRGAGMDMGFHLVYSLSSTLHGDGYALSHRWL